jgi:CheY-like chemotaxis protein
MQKVFFNLIGNAFKYVKPQTGKISIELNDSGSQVEIVIRDNGIGIPADQSSLIFDRFYQIENNPSNKDGQGSGIGLALSKGIVEAHGGTIGFTSEPGHGTLFFVHLKKGNTHFKPEELNDEPPTPAEEIPVSEYLPHKPTEPFNQEDPSEDRPTLLIVDDTDEVREMLSDLFAPTYRISLAANGEEAIERAMKEQPDLIISDVMMPGMSGTELCVKIKRNIQTCHIPVILLTARTALSYKLEGIETGADDYIEKPFNVKLLKARVQNLLLNRKILQKKFSSEPDFEVKSLAINQLDKKLLEKASAIINDNLSEPDFGIDDFAAAIGLGRTKLFEKIKGLTGQTPNDFIQTIRMNKAAELLVKSPELTISEIAYLVGFNSPKYFSSCFRRHFGVTPSQYTKKP